MDIFEAGLLTKGVKTGILGVFLIILVIQLIITKNKIVRDAKILNTVFVLLGFSMNLFEVIIIPKSLSLVLPTSNQYFGHNLTRFTFLVLLGFILAIIVIRLLFFKQKRYALGRTTEKVAQYGGTTEKMAHYEYSRHYGVKLNPQTNQDPERKINLPETVYPNVNSRLIVISSLGLGVFIILRNMFRPLQRTSDMVWIIFELVEVLLWVFLGVSMLTFKERIQDTQIVK